MKQTRARTIAPKLDRTPGKSGGISRLATVIPVALALASCSGSEPKPVPSPTPTMSQAVSIFRPEVKVDRQDEALDPLEATVSFADGGSELSDLAREQIAAILASPQLELGGAITLRGNTDSQGNDNVNLRASRKRAETVRDYMITKGVAEERIEVIALGEMRPAAPNAKLDGSPDEAGRAANRRVDVSIAIPGQPELAQAKPTNGDPEDKKPGTLVEAITKAD